MKPSKLSRSWEVSLFGAPKAPGLYAICVGLWYSDIGAEHLMYIGSSKNMGKRVYNGTHHYNILFARFQKSPDYGVYVRYIDMSGSTMKEILEAEKAAIKEYRPPLNIRHNG